MMANMGNRKILMLIAIGSVSVFQNQVNHPKRTEKDIVRSKTSHWKALSSLSVTSSGDIGNS